MELVEGGLGALAPHRAFDAGTLILVLHFLKEDAARPALLTELAARLKSGALLPLARSLR